MLVKKTKCKYSRDYLQYVGFKALTAVAMKRSILWDITPCSPLKADVSEEHVVFIRSKCL
jgi:hypothetical protein